MAPPPSSIATWALGSAWRRRLAMLTSLTLCAQHGILVKDGRALELMRKVDTFLFDKTGTLTRERPEVGRILTFGPYSEQQILQWAAAAENKFSHPIAKAISGQIRIARPSNAARQTSRNTTWATESR